MNSIFLTPHSEPCTQSLSPPPLPPQRRNVTHNRAVDGKDDFFSAPLANKRARMSLPIMPLMDDNDNVSFADMLPKTRFLSRRNTGFQPSWQSSHRGNDMELPDSVDANEALRLMPFKKSISSAFSLARSSNKRSTPLVFLSKAA